MDERTVNNRSGGERYSLLRELLWMLGGEATVCCIVIGIYAIVGIFVEGVLGPRLFLGLALGTLISVANYAFLSISVNRAIDGFLSLRGDVQMDDDEALEFTQKNAMTVQNAATRSYMIRMLSMAAALLVSFLLLKMFDPIATAVPLLAFRPVLYVVGLLRRPKAKAACSNTVSSTDNESTPTTSGAVTASHTDTNADVNPYIDTDADTKVDTEGGVADA